MDNIRFYADLILKTEEAIDCFHVQNFYYGNIYLSRIIDNIATLFNRTSDTDSPIICDDVYLSEISSSLEPLFNAQSHKDYVLIADILEMQLLPTIQNILQQLTINITAKTQTAFIEQNYFENNILSLTDKALAKKISDNRERLISNNNPALFVEATNIGENTLKYDDGNNAYYYHSNINPIREGTSFARYYGKDDSYDYIILGFGFGYHIEGMLDYDKRYTVTALESDLDVLTLAFMHRDLTKLLSDRQFILKYIDLSDNSNILPDNNNSILLIHYPSLLSLKDGFIKNKLNDYFISISSMYSQKKYLDWNFHFNVSRNDTPADTIMEKLAGKSVVYIGGGPSLEDHIEYLQNISSSKEKVIITASTSYGKLIENNIIPDYVIMIDAKDSMINHIKGIPETNASLIYLCTASRFAVNEFKGECFILFQNGYDKAEEYADKRSLTLIETGGSVSTAAIDFILKSGCRELMTMGLDLAYTDNKSHSFDTDAKKDMSNYITVKGVSGGIVYTTNVLNIYRLWIERRIKNEKRLSDISLVNVSRGAYIDGMMNVETPI